MVVMEEPTDIEPGHEWWFNLEEYEVTIEYKKEVKKWFLVVTKKRLYGE